MGNKKLIFGVTAIVIAAAIFVISEQLTSIRPPEHRTRFFPGLEERHITAVTINNGGDVIRLVKMDDVWMAGKEDDFQPADESLVQIAVERLLSLRKSELSSVNPDNQRGYGVDTAAVGNSSVEIFTDDQNAPAHTVIIGRGGPDWNSNYVRLAGSAEVYLVSGNLRQALFFGIDRWKKPTVTEPEQATETDAERESEPDPEQKESPGADAAT